ncbi:MAG: hypothetical protein ABI355_06880 [Solirubrobacteraceae bacterium]
MQVGGITAQDARRGPKCIQNQGNHQRRVIGRAAVTIGAIRGIKRRKVHLIDRRDHKPRQMILRQPLPQRRRQQERLLTIRFDEILGHPRSQLTKPDRPPLRDSLS